MLLPNRKIQLNISGAVYETYEQTLHRFPDTLLGDPRRRDKYYDFKSKVYFFNRSRASFDAVLFYYQSNGCLVRPPWLPMQLFEYECLFFELGEDAIKQMKEREGYDSQKKVFISKNNHNRLQVVWEFLEYPESSLPARIYIFISLLLIVFSVMLDCFESLPELQIYQKKETLFDPWDRVKLSLKLFFAVEFILRFISSPSKYQFSTSAANIVDVLAIFPSFLIYVINQKHVESLLFVRVLRTFRIFRLVRLSKSFETLSVVLHILSKSLPDLLVLVFCMIISCTVFGSMMFYTELGIEDTQISSIPEGMWFAMQTVVSIGYGDIVPASAFGKLTAAATAVFGALTMTVPLLSLGGRYFSIYTKTFGVSLNQSLITIPSPNVKNKEEK